MRNLSLNDFVILGGDLAHLMHTVIGRTWSLPFQKTEIQIYTAMNESRRSFIKKSAAGVALFTILPRKVFGAMGGDKSYVAPSDQLTRGIIGTGGIGMSGLHFVSDDKCRLVSVCDVDRNHLDNALRTGEQKFGEKLQAYDDWRDLVHDPNVDIVHIATPSHWHGIMAVEACKAGKDIFCEKPMTRTIGEGQKVVDAVRKYGRIFRVLGWPLTVRISGATGFTWKFYWTGKENLEPQPVPKELNYDMWLGPAPFKPYHPHRVHQNFRGYWDYESGGLGDMGQHYIDPVQYILGKDDTFPVKVEVDAPAQHPDAVGIWRSITYTYSDGCKIILEGEGFESQGKVPYIEGPLGKVYKGFECTIPNVMDIINAQPDPEPRNTDFLECVRTRQKFALAEENGHHSCTIVNLGSCALRLGRTLHFDPERQVFIGDDAANELINQPMRAPWGSMIL